MSEWWDTVITVKQGIVLKTSFLNMTPSRVCIWETVSGAGCVTDGQVFYTGQTTIHRSMGKRDSVHRFMMDALMGSVD